MAAEAESAYNYGLEYVRKVVLTTNLHIFSTLFLMMACTTQCNHCQYVKFSVTVETGDAYNYGLLSATILNLTH
jgi:hypothetical protein